MFIEEGIKLDFSDVLIRPQFSSVNSRSEPDLRRTFKGIHNNSSGIQFNAIPIMPSNMDSTGTLMMADTMVNQGAVGMVHKHHDFENEEFRDYISHFNNKVFVNTGISDKDFNRITTLHKEVGFHFLCIDVANGYMDKFIERIKEYRYKLDNVFIMAGNVVTQDAAQRVIEAGADCVKVGIGNGSVCTTRLQTGVGYPQLSALIECANYVHGIGGYVCCDGGVNNIGDICKAFGAGSDFVMSGSMFAGCTESAGKMVTVDGKAVKEYYGMSSLTAQDKHHGGLSGYRSAEGKTVHTEFIGDAENVLKDIYGGIRSYMAYVSASEIKHASKRTTFIITTGGQENRKFS